LAAAELLKAAEIIGFINPIIPITIINFYFPLEEPGGILVEVYRIPNNSRDFQNRRGGGISVR
jgi:hypothetical protein